MNWSALPADLLLSIAEHLETRTDLMNFREVCQTWRYSVPLSLFASTNILSALFPYTNLKNPSSILTVTSVFLVQSLLNPDFPPWLVSVEELNPGKLFLRAPLSRVAIKNPPFCSKKTVDLSNFHWQELGRFYSLRRADQIEEMFSERRLNRYDNKVVLFVNPNCNEKYPNIDDCSIVELYDHTDYLTLTHLKTREEQHVYFKRSEFDDIVSFKGRIFAVDYQGRVCFMDYHSLKMYSFTEAPLADVSRSNYKKRLAVGCCGELYLIYRRCQRSDDHDLAFKMFKMNEDLQRWEEIEGVGDDRIVFVTFDGCFFGFVKDFPGWKGNCIVFRRGSFPEYSGLGEFDNKIFETWNVNLDVAVFHFGDGDCVPIRSYPWYSQVVWPPQSWFFEKRGRSGRSTTSVGCLSL